LSETLVGVPDVIPGKIYIVPNQQATSEPVSLSQSLSLAR